MILTIAVSKGRLFSWSLQFIRMVGVLTNYDATSRNLVFQSSDPKVLVFNLKASDVPFSVLEQLSDIGFAGGDVIGDCGFMPLVSYPLDPNSCSVAVASQSEDRQKGRNLVVATKYIKTAKIFVGTAARIKLVKLNGAVEASPPLKLSDAILDIVSTGNTLKANGLVLLKRIVLVPFCVIHNTKLKKENKKRLGCWLFC
ncbi:ATP phosphoribosyltransferase catalytic subunit [Candidatus Tremblaya phenacola PAVE]|nr:ATP phosphoribosyltransferase catalytic subunit [Candidatus Tremblaya phenacola PAVE]